MSQNKKMKRCELCNNMGKIYCESDVAVLCWDCDSIVHGANYLVARHIRTLLCHRCQSPTPWNGSGPKLVSTVSACSNCIDTNACGEEMNNTDDDDDLDDIRGDEQNQVVTWPVSSSSKSEECSNRSQESGSQSTTVVSFKRKCDTIEPASRDRSGYSFPAHQRMNLSNEPTSSIVFGSSKGRK